MSAQVGNGEAAAFAAAGDAGVELVSATCACCSLKEECTPAYIAEVRERFSGQWVCGLCGEAIEDEIRRARPRISITEALSRHSTFSENFRSAASPTESSEKLIAAMRQLLRRGLDSPRAVRSTPNSPLHEAVASPSAGAASGGLARSNSCFSTLSQFIKRKGETDQKRR